MKKIYIILSLDTNSGEVLDVVNAFECKKEALKYYPDEKEYIIRAINLNPKQLLKTKTKKS